MYFLIVLFIVLGLTFYMTSQISDANDPLVGYYVTWATTLISLNVLIATFIYMFTNSVKQSEGNQGVRGKVGRRGPEGRPDFCKFECPKSKND